MKIKEKFKKIYNNLFFRNILIVFFSLFFIELSIRLLLYEPFFDWAMFRIFVGCILLSFVFNLLSLFFNFNGRKIFLFLIILFLGIYSWFQFCLYNYLDFFMSISNIGQGMKAKVFLTEVFSNVTADVYLILMPIILLLFYYLIFEKKIDSKFLKKTNNLKFKSNMKYDILISCFIFILCIFLYIGTLNFKFMQDDLQVIPNKFLIVSPVNSNLVVKQFGTCGYFISDFFSSIFGLKNNMYLFDENDYINKKINKKKYNVTIENDIWLKIIENDYNSDISNINKFLFTREISKKNNMTGIFKDKNLIIILLESTNMMAIDKEKFPTFYKLYNDGISFSNNYSPKSYCSTANSEISSMTGLFPSNNICTISYYNSMNNTYFQSIFNVFKKTNYTVSSYHGYPDVYYPRNKYHYLVGSDKFYDADKLGIDYYEDRKNWSSDIDLIDASLSKYVDKDKFLSYIITVTPHLLYSKKSNYDKYMNLWNDKDYTEDTKRYLAKLKVIDIALNKLMVGLEKEGKLDDTVIALFSDHYPIGLTKNEIRDVLGNDMRDDINDFDKTPMMIYNSKFNGYKVDKYTTISDLVPTLLNLFGMKYDSRLYLGNDVFSDYEDSALFADGSWRNKYGFYDATRSEFIKLNDKNNVNNSYLAKINQYNTDRILVNDMIFKNNYFAYLEKKLNEYQK